MTATVARCMKARWSARAGCGCYVLRGQLIVNRGGGWHCLPCALAAIRATTTDWKETTMTTTPRDFAESDLGKELIASLQTVEQVRNHALQAAVYAEHQLPGAMITDKIADCTHARDENCGCYRMTPEEWAGNARLMEEATADRILRNAQRFFDWLTHGLTPELKREYELREMQDGDRWAAP
jgi:hypothetical protein